jgi:hypothetical protein
MKKVYPKRPELMKLPAFAGFEAELDRRLAQAKLWEELARKNQAKILNADRVFAMNKLYQQWLDLGVNLRGPGALTDKEKADMARIQKEIEALEKEQADEMAEAAKQAGVEPVTTGGPAANAFFGTDEAQKDFVESMTDSELYQILGILNVDPALYVTTENCS